MSMTLSDVIYRESSPCRKEFLAICTTEDYIMSIYYVVQGQSSRRRPVEGISVRGQI